jgi:hypothetical protein
MPCSSFIFYSFPCVKFLVKFVTHLLPQSYLLMFYYIFRKKNK